MNLKEMVDFVCGKMGKTDTASKTTCKGFVRRRYELIWNDQLWKASLVQFDVTIDVAKGAVLAGVIELPNFLINRVVAVRSTENRMDPAALEGYYRADPDQFALTGEPLQWFEMGPAVATFGGFYALSIAAASAADNGTPVVISYLNQADNQVTSTINITTTATEFGTAKEILSFSKPVTSGNVTITGGPVTSYTLTKTQTIYDLTPRIRILPRPTKQTILKVLAKSKLTPLEGDYDEPRLRNVENALIGFALGDMWQRSRQFGKAEMCYTEAITLLEQLKRIEVWQAGNRPKLTPEVYEPAGHPDDWPGDAWLRGS